MIAAKPPATISACVEAAADHVVEPAAIREASVQKLVHRDRHEVVVLRLVAAGDGLLADPVVHRTPHDREEARRVREERRREQDERHPEAGGGDRPGLRAPEHAERDGERDQEDDRRRSRRSTPATRCASCRYRRRGSSTCRRRTAGVLHAGGVLGAASVPMTMSRFASGGISSSPYLRASCF